MDIINRIFLNNRFSILGDLKAISCKDTQFLRCSRIWKNYEVRKLVVLMLKLRMVITEIHVQIDGKIINNYLMKHKITGLVIDHLVI